MATSKLYEQADFSVGEIDPDHVLRVDTKVRGQSVRSALNCQLLNSGAASARPGSSLVEAQLGDGWLFVMVVNATVYFCIITPGALRVYLQSTRAKVVELTGQPWTADMMPPLRIAPYGNQAFVFHASLPTQIIAVDTTGAWTVTPMSFGAGYGGALRQPYYRFAAPGLTVTPSALTGAVTLAASAPYFVAGHVGLRFQLQGREVDITGVTDSTHATATVVQSLYPTKTIMVASSPNYDVGELIQGEDSNAQGVVIATSGTNVTVLMNTFTDFFYDSAATPPTGENVVGLNASLAIQATPSTPVSPAPVLEFTEQAISAVRGYPATGTIHDNRLMLGALPQVQFGILGSAIDDFSDFQVGTSDSDAFFELIGDTDSGVVQHLCSVEQLLVMTTRHMLYVPESESYPLTPTNFTLLRTGPDGAGSAVPVSISEGAIYVNTAGGSVIGAFPTGDVRRSWRTTNMSYLCSHLIKQPRQIAYVSGAPTISERYAYLVNADGTMAVLTYDDSDANAVPGWTPWSTQGVWRSVAAYDGECWTLVQRTLNGETIYTLEVFDSARWADAMCDVAATAYVGPSTGQTVLTPAGPQATDSLYICPALAGSTCSLLIGGGYLGEVTLDAAGLFGVPDYEGAISLGFGFQSQLVRWPPLDEPNDNASRVTKRRISGIVMRYTGRLMSVNGAFRPAYDGGDDTSQPPPIRDETYRFPGFGWSYEPTATVARPYAAPWVVYGITFEVKS